MAAVARTGLNRLGLADRIAARSLLGLIALTAVPALTVQSANLGVCGAVGAIALPDLHEAADERIRPILALTLNRCPALTGFPSSPLGLAALDGLAAGLAAAHLAFTWIADEGVEAVVVVAWVCVGLLHRQNEF